MIVVAILAVLALFDGALAGFRAVAGRDGRIDKRALFRAAILRGARVSLVVIAANAALVAVLVMTAGDRDALWTDFVRAGTTCAWVFGAFATSTLIALALWFAPVHEYRLLATVIVLGPLTLVRPLVIVAGLVAGAATVTEPRVWLAALVAGITMLGIEHYLGRAHAERWRALVR